MKQYGFPKAEHLCLRRDIDALFTAGTKSFSAYPLRLLVRPAGEGRIPCVRVLTSVPKRRLRHAVDRNRAKRQVREAYRLHKSVLWAKMPDEKAINIAFMWQSNAPVDTKIIMEKVSLLLHRAAEALPALFAATPDETPNDSSAPKP